MCGNPAEAVNNVISDVTGKTEARRQTKAYGKAVAEVEAQQKADQEAAAVRQQEIAAIAEQRKEVDRNMAKKREAATLQAQNTIELLNAQTQSSLAQLQALMAQSQANTAKAQKTTITFGSGRGPGGGQAASAAAAAELAERNRAISAASSAARTSQSVIDKQNKKKKGLKVPYSVERKNESRNPASTSAELKVGSQGALPGAGTNLPV